MTDITVLQRTQVIRVDPASGKVSVTNAGPPGPPADPTLGPRVTAVEGEMDDLQAAETTISALPAASTPDGTELVPVDQGGTTKKMTLGRLLKHKIGTAGGVVSNTTTETTVMTWAMAADEILEKSLYRVNIWGSVVNNTGASRTTTVRFKLNAVTAMTLTITQATNGERAFNVEFLVIASPFGAVFLILGNGRKWVAAVGAGSFEQDLPVIIAGSAPDSAHNWTVTVQHSFASTDLSATTLAVLAEAV